MYLAGIRQIHYADFERVSFNYMLYDALIKQKERDDASTNGKERDSAMEAPRRRRKRKRDSGNRQANKRAYI
ncbi:uncharacterized protein PHACADRAFT_249043 [Phanerochaete carnosa HHB-10118-sp]|uniref:Uncharacterized protein n=1 Tax=Phanerochaete carnosa (strain HHB-10118-sp) TaxID=650164 RepID=K5WIJ5_PHACS|nr:uncharacterized protein PHACADRAFT_249043 [Phanerochaete carnosa HHB-10118-sp]EKM58924.1 hypothetical protein PHACADRAFT_249043 [Phanerochaete carnosa HHB-10118-sp]